MLNLLRNMKPGESIEVNCIKTGEFRIVAYTEKCSKGDTFQWGDVIDAPDPSLVVQVRAYSALEQAREAESKLGPIEKEPFVEFYIMPVVDAFREFFEDVWHKVSGAWWCDYCKRYHGRRVSSYKVLGPFVNATVCSRGHDALKAKTWVPTNMLDSLLSNIFGSKKEEPTCKPTMRR